MMNDINKFPEDPNAPKAVKPQRLIYRRHSHEIAAYEVIYPNGKYIGDLQQLEDGYYNFFPDPDNYGCWSPWVMREIADQMDRLNKDWHDQLMRRIK